MSPSQKLRRTPTKLSSIHAKSKEMLMKMGNSNNIKKNMYTDRNSYIRA